MCVCVCVCECEYLGCESPAATARFFAGEPLLLFLYCICVLRASVCAVFCGAGKLKRGVYHVCGGFVLVGNCRYE